MPPKSTTSSDNDLGSMGCRVSLGNGRFTFVESKDKSGKILSYYLSAAPPSSSTSSKARKHLSRAVLHAVPSELESVELAGAYQSELHLRSKSSEWIERLFTDLQSIQAPLSVVIGKKYRPDDYWSDVCQEENCEKVYKTLGRVE
jgi:hypothetical protein